MNIYAEDFFIFNFLMDFAVFKTFSFVLRLKGEFISGKRLLFSLIVSSALAFLPEIFFEGYIYFKYFIVFIIPILLCGLKKYIFHLFYVNIISALFSGILYSVDYFFNEIFGFSLNPILILLLSILGCIVFSNIFKKFRNTVLNDSLKRRVVFENNGRSFESNGFVDSGNVLTDAHGRPVSAVSKDVIKNLSPIVEDYILVETVSGKKIFPEYKIEKMSIIVEDKKTVNKDVFVIVINSEQKSNNQVILNSQFA